MADIAWSISGVANFSPEERDCAVRGGTWDRAKQDCIIAQPLPPAPPLNPISGPPVGGGTTYVYTVEMGWVPLSFAESDGLTIIAAPGSTAVPIDQPGTLPAVIPSGSVFGQPLPIAAPVALPSFVGGLLGTVRMGGGMRPMSGGTPKRVVMGTAVLPQVRMGVNNWGR